MDEMQNPEPTEPLSERARLQATALVAGTVSREESRIVTKKAVRKITGRTLMREGVIVIMVVALAVLAFRSATEASRNRKEVLKIVQQQCRLYGDLGRAPLAANQQPLGLKLVADTRNVYVNIGCVKHFGKLNPVTDKRLLPLLQDDAK